MQIAAKEIALILGGTLEGEENVLVDKPGNIEEGGAGTLTFLANPKYESFVYTTKSAVLLVNKNFKPSSPVAASALIRVDDVYGSIGILMEKFGSREEFAAHISEKSSISPHAKLADKVSIGDFAVVESNAEIGTGTAIHPQVFVGKNVIIGNDCILYPGVKIYHDCQIGNRCILQANSVIGSDGFGFAPQNDGSYRKIPHIGNVVIEDDVEIGANTTIDRATMGSTIIRKGVKLDNLIMVAHNVEIGDHTAVAAQAGFAGSAKIGKQCRIGGQSGFVGHIHVADGTQVQAQSGVASNIENPGTALYGSPAIGYTNFLRSFAVFKKLPELLKRIQQIEKEIDKPKE